MSVMSKIRYTSLCSAVALVAAISIVTAGPAGQAPAGAVTGGFAAQTRPTGVQRFDDPAEGARSPRNANYDIDVSLDHERRTLRARETIRWRNISSQAATELQFHLYWNAWRDADSTWLRERRLLSSYTPPRDDAWGSTEVTAIRVRQPDGSTIDLTPQIRYIAPDDGNAADRTVMTVPVPATVQPNETVQIEIEWDARIPRPFARTGYIDDYYFIAQWFPKIGVLEDAGWNTHQFHGIAEFYADFGVYDVRITVPDGFVIGASGRETQRVDHADGTTTHRYRGEDVHDFAWTASPRFIESRRTFEHPTLPRVEMRLLLQPEHRGQEDRLFDAAAATLRLFGEWFGPYPYDHLTIVDPAYQSGSGGMEYPTLFTAGTRWIAPREATVPEAVTIHEAGHQFWYGIVATNEPEHAWMDEGLTTFGTARVIEAIDHPYRLVPRFFGGFVPWVIDDVRLSRATDGNRLNTYRNAAMGDAPSTPTYRYWPGTATATTYDKTALWLHTLERHLGWPVLQRILATYVDRWQFRHPTPADFFAVANEVSGQDLTWFFDQVYRGSSVFDYGVQEVRRDAGADGRSRTTVVVNRLGDATFPIDIVTTFEDGEQISERWDGVDRRVIYVYERASRASMVQVDPERVLLLDVNYTNNSRTMQPRSEDAGLKWSLTWMVWLQDLMITYGFFV
jgi:aminopeptidase N